MIGAEKTADNFQKTIDMFGGAVPFDRGERIDMLDELSENEDFDGFEEIDDCYYENKELENLMDEYVKKHLAEFVVDGEYDYFEVN